MKKRTKTNRASVSSGMISFIFLNFLRGNKILVSVTDRAGKIIYVNNRFVRLTKYSKEELIGQNHRLLKSGYHSQDEFDELWSTISRGMIWRGNLKNQAKDGSFFWVDTVIKPIIGKNRRPRNYIAIRFTTKNQQ